MIQCPTCGSDVADDAAVCTDCGMELAPSAPPPIPVTDTGPERTVVLEKADEAGPSFDAGFNLDDEMVPPAPPALNTIAPDISPPPVAPPAPPAQITLKRNGVLTTETFPLGERATIGRFDADSGPVDVDLGPLPEASYVSRHHAEIRREGDEWKLKDLGARNGTFVRRVDSDKFERVSGEQSIGDGDEIALGNARFEFRAGA